MVTVVTSFSKPGYLEYGHKFLRSFGEFWAKEIDLRLYTEAPLKSGPGKHATDRHVGVIDTRWLPERQVFMNRYARSPAANGRGVMPCWKEKDKGDGYSYRTDAVKFSNKVFAIHNAAEGLKTGGLIWIDADVVTTAHVEPHMIAKIISDCDVAYLGRERGTSECGFIYFSLPAALDFIRAWTDLYNTGAIFKLSEWHDSYAFDHMREKFTSLVFKDISSPRRRQGHVWVDSPLGAFSDHLKGERKKIGRSPEMATRQAS